jgi:hypothetical protein
MYPGDGHATTTQGARTIDTQQTSNRSLDLYLCVGVPASTYAYIYIYIYLSLSLSHNKMEKIFTLRTFATQFVWLATYHSWPTVS